MVVRIFWVVVGGGGLFWVCGSGYFLGSSGWWWVVVDYGGWWWVVAQFIISQDCKNILLFALCFDVYFLKVLHHGDNNFLS